MSIIFTFKNYLICFCFQIKPHKCTLCPKSFPTPGDLRSHMYIHNGSWPFRCSVCYRGFSKQTNLKNHITLHSGARRNCKIICIYLYTLLIFTGSRPHMCSICSKTFALQCNLKAHIKLHTQCRKQVEDVTQKEFALQEKKLIIPESYSLEHQRNLYYNDALNFSFGKLFSFNQRFLMQYNTDKGWRYITGCRDQQSL